MKKLPFIFSLLITAVFTSAFSIKDGKNLLYHQIKLEAQKNFSDLFHQKVTIREAGGIIIGQIILKDVNIPGIGEAPQIILSFNPIKYVFTKGDIIPALTKITVHNAKLNIVRDKNNRWNILSLLSEKEKGGSPPPPFRGRLILKNCQVIYLDWLGFQKSPRKFIAEANSVNGSVDLREKDKIKFAVSCKLPEFVKAQGQVNLKTGAYEVIVNAYKLNLNKWANYAVPLPGFNFRSGEGDLILKVSPPKTKGWAASIVGKVSFYNTAGHFQSLEFNRVLGDLFISDQNLAFSNLKLEINRLPITINGRFYNFAKQNLDLNAAVENADLKNIIAFFPQAKELDLKGKGSANIKIRGTWSQPKIEGDVNIPEGLLYQQKFICSSHFSLKDFLLHADVDFSHLYGGTAFSRVTIDFSKKIPKLNFQGTFSNLNLAALAQNSPGIEGNISGQLEASGAINDLEGQLQASFPRAFILGQPLETLRASFQFKNGELFLKSCRASSANSLISASGKISRDLVFDLRSEAYGLKLSGKGIFGKMRTTLNKFHGNLLLKLNPEFLAYPLRNLSASGEVVLSDGQIGEQFFDEAQGKITIGGGKISIEKAFIKRENSVLEVSGQTGVGVPTALRIVGQKINLEDLKILNYLLPLEAKDPKGWASLEAEISGTLPAETQLTTLDPLLNLTMKGKFSITKGFIGEMPISSMVLEMSWQDHAFSIPSCQVATPVSSFSLNFISQNDGTLSGALKGTVDLSHFRSFTKKYGRLSGWLGLNLKIEGTKENPVLNASFWAKNLQFNEIYFDEVSGNFLYDRGKITLAQPVLFRNGSDLYALSGSATFPVKSPSESTFDLELKILQADLPSTYCLFRKVQDEVARRFALPGQIDFAKINPANLILPTWKPFTQKNHILLYSANGKKEYFLKTWNDIRSDFEKSLASAPEENLGGRLSGNFKVNGPLNNLSGQFTAKITNGHFKTFAFDDFSASATLKNQEIKIDKATLSKGKGVISARGSYNFNGQVSLHATANNMPLDILLIAFPHKEFRGVFNMDASFDGPIENLKISLSASGRQVNLAGVNFDKVTLSVAEKNKNIYLHELSLLQGNTISGVHGKILFSPPKQIDLAINLKENAIGLLNLITDELKWKSGSALLSAKIQGTIDNPQVSGEIKVEKATVYIRALDSDIYNLYGKASITNHLLTINSLSGVWVGERTKYRPNFLGMAGIIDLSKMFAEKGQINLNLSFSPTHLSLAFPNLYTGSLHVNKLALQGPLHFDFSQGPTLKGELGIENAVITLSQGTPTGTIFPLNFDLTANLTKNVYAVMGDVATLNLSNIFMNLEIAGNAIKIGGNLEKPSLLGKISIKRGTVNIFNREFTLLSPEMQKRFFPYDPDKIQENVALFLAEGSSGIMPNINLTSSVNVENLEKDQSGQYVKKQVIVLARLKGTMGVKEEEHGVKISLLGFTEDKTKSPPEMIPAAYREQDLKVMLLPDFIKSLVGISRPEEVSQEKVDTNTIITDYLSSRLQTVLFRSLEREVEQRLGLESLTLEYNLGPKMREAMGIKETSSFEEEKPAWSVGFVKGFFERLYIDVRYAQGTEQTAGSAATTSFNYQLTYKINPIWSIIYYREPISLTELVTGYQKITLKAGFSLW